MTKKSIKSGKNLEKSLDVKFYETALYKGLEPIEQVSLGNIAKVQAIRHSQFKKQTLAKNFLKGVPNSHRFHNCLTASRDKSSLNIAIMSNSDQKCNYSGLQTCGSRSVCTCCSPRLCEISRQDITKASNQHLVHGGGFALMTMTIPHKLTDKLEDLIRLGTLARNKFNECNKVKLIYKKIGRLGYVRAFEIKHGANGWHPHQHFLFYLEKPITEQLRIQIESDLLSIWQDCCLKVGLDRPNHHGLDFMSCTDPLKASSYVIKDAFELTYSNTKGSKKGSINPFDLLSDEPYQYGSRKRLFREYYLATKGKSIIFWSRGLKKRFNIETLDDDEEAINQYNDAEYTIAVVKVDIFDWAIVKKYDLRAELLEFTEDYIKSSELISVQDYDAYINMFFIAYNLDINQKKILEPEPQSEFYEHELKTDPWLSHQGYLYEKSTRPSHFKYF
jgi:hypothetical protein